MPNRRRGKKRSAPRDEPDEGTAAVRETPAAQREAPERANLGGVPYQGHSEPVSGGPQGNRSSQPTIADFIDFENILNEQLPHIQTDSVSNLPVESLEPLPIIQNSFSFNKQMVRLGSDDIAGHVPVQLCNKIWSHEYINISLLLKGSVELQDIFDSGIVRVSGRGYLETRSLASSKDVVPNIEKWTDAFLIFTSVYLKRYPNKAQELLQYINLIREAASHSTNFAWRSYDEQFRLRQTSQTQSWGKINSDLWLRVMTSNSVLSRTATATTSSNQDESSRVLGTCFDFNDGFCGRATCKFRHICSNCQAPNHGRVTCFRLTGSNPAQRGRGGAQSRGTNRGGRPPFRRGANRQ